ASASGTRLSAADQRPRDRVRLRKHLQAAHRLLPPRSESPVNNLASTPRRSLSVCALVLLSASAVRSQAPPALSVPADSPRWELQAQARPTEYQGRKCLLLQGGAAVLKDFEMHDAVIDVDVTTPARRGFFGIQFRIADDDATAEQIYLRQHKSGLPDAMQYMPVLGGGNNWQIYSGPGFTGAVEIPRDVWFRVRLEVTGAQARFF